MTTTRTNLVIVGDFGKDQDDEATLVLAKQLVALLHVDLLAVVANLSPSSKRAQLAKGTLEKLALPKVPVGIGTDCTVKDTGLSNHEFDDVAYMASEDRLQDGQQLLADTLSRAADKSVTLLLISGLTDAAQFITTYESLAAQKLQRVVIMGGVKVEGDSVVLDADGYMQPDSAANNNFDVQSAEFLYRRLQELGISMTILTRNAVYACKVPRKLYDTFASTRHPVGIKIRDTQKKLSTKLWDLANLPADDPKRERLPARCDRQWFLNTFCDGHQTERTGDQEIWDLVTNFCLYDPMALVAATQTLCDKYYAPDLVEVNGTVHQIIGVSPTKTGVLCAEKLVDTLKVRLHAALLMSRRACGIY